MRKMRNIAAMSAVCLALTGMTAAMPAGAVVMQDEESYIEGTLGDFTYWKYTNHVTIAGFNRDSEVTEVVIPANIEGLPVTEIGQFAFGYNEYYGPYDRPYNNLQKVIIPNSVTSIGYDAFANCSKLTEVVLSKNLNRIETNAFYNCIGITEIVIPKSVTYIGTSAFDNYYVYDYDAMSDVYYEGTEEEWNSITIMSALSSNKYLLNATIHYNYVAEDALAFGDLDGDSDISAVDAQLALQAAAELMAGNDSGLNPAQLSAADIDGDGELTVADAQFILNYYAAETLGGYDVTWQDILDGKY